MYAYLGVRPAILGHESHPKGTLGGAKLVLNEMSIHVGFVNILWGPVQMISDKDVFGKASDVLSRVIAVKHKTHGRTVLIDEKAQLVKAGAKMKSFTEPLIKGTNSLRGPKVPMAFPVFSP